MAIEIKSQTKDRVVIEVTVELAGSMLESEEAIEQALNEAGSVVTGEALKRFDTDGSPLRLGTVKLTSKGQVETTYQTPYGATRVERHVYQSSQGGATFCPLENNARVIQGATPKFAKSVSHKYSKLSVDEVKMDLAENHGRAWLYSTVGRSGRGLGASQRGSLGLCHTGAGSGCDQYWRRSGRNHDLST